MEYEIEVTVPANTLASSPVVETLKLDKGVLEEGWIYFPYGCAHLVQVRVFKGAFQIAPFNRDGWLRGNGARVPLATKYDMTEAPFYLTVKACSPGTTLEHKITVHVGLNPVYVARPENVIVGQLKGIKTRLDQVSDKGEDFMEKVKGLLPRRVD
jgi:hypothetical protein